MKAVYLKDKIGNKIVTTPYYRVGDLFLTTIATNPSNFLGGTWELFGPGRCLVCVDTSDSDFNTVKKTGGSKTVTLTIEQIPSHNHKITYTMAYGANDPYRGLNYGSIQAGNFSDRAWSDNTGGGQAHNNLQPYITCYIWIRTA